MGKTTLTQHIADSFQKTETAKVIFINSYRIIANLQKIGSNRALDLYSFYEANHNNEIEADEDYANRKGLSRDTFKHGLDNGNLLIVIDGLDEIISKVNSFTFEVLIESIRESTKNIGLGKIIITSRDGEWIDKTFEQFRNIIDTYEILPFDEDLTRDFLKKKGLYGKKVETIIRNLKKVVLPIKEEELAFPPYVIDVVGDFDENLDNTSHLITSLLDTKKPQDYTIASICNREIIRQEQVDIDMQFSVLMELTVEYEGVIRKEKLFPNILSKFNIPEDKLQPFCIHPFITEMNDDIRLKYDHFGDHFKGIFIANLISKKSNTASNIKIVNILSNDCTYKSLFVKDIVSRLDADSSIDKIKEVIERVYYFLLENYPNNEVLLAIVR